MKHTTTTEYLKEIEGIRLSEASKARMRADLSAYADFHAAMGGVRETDEARSMGYIPQRSVWSSLFVQLRSHTTMYAKAGLLIALMVAGGGTSFAAQGSVPGDALYPVKVHVNENVRSALAIGTNAQARLEADLLKERVEEAKELAARGELNSDTEADMNARIAEQAKETSEASAHADADVAASIHADLATALSVNAADTVRSEGGAATDVAARLNTTIDAALNIATAMSTQLAGEANVDAKLESVTVHAEALKATLDANAELGADVRADLSAKVNAAFEAIADARASIAADAMAAADASVDTAANIVGDVEATLSTMGKVDIDTDTGAIIDLDLHDDASTTDVTGSSDTSVDSDADATVSGTVDTVSNGSLGI